MNKYSIMILLVKHDGINLPEKLMDEASKYHLSKKAKEQQNAKDFNSHKEMIKSIPEDVGIFLKDKNRKLFYFGITKEQFDRLAEK